MSSVGSRIQRGPDLTRDLQIAPQPLLGILVVASMAVGLGAIPSLTHGDALRIALFILGMAVLGWSAHLIGEQVVRWICAISWGAAIFWVADGMRQPQVLWLLAFTSILGIALVGLRGTSLLVALEAVLVLILGRTTGWLSPPSAFGAVVILVLGYIVGQSMYWPVWHLAEWSWLQYEEATRLLAQARERQSDLKEALGALSHSNRELALANEKMASLRRMAEQAERTKTSFVSNVSHEFRTPLNMIIGLVDLATETPEVYGESLPPALMQDLEIVHRNCNHLSSMINDVLDLSQIEAGRLALRREMTSLSDILHDAVQVVEPLVAKKDLELRLEVPDDLPGVFCDPTRIRQVVLNLVSNAARFTESGSISVSAYASVASVTVNVTDTGPGIAPEHVEQIFEPFIQGPSDTQPTTKGSGLGLAISRQFVELHGGRMRLTSELGVGSTFSFTLPVAALTGLVAPPQRWISEGWTDRRTGVDVKAPQLLDRIVLADASGDVFPVLDRYAENVEIVHVEDVSETADAVQRSSAAAVMINAPQAQLWDQMRLASRMVDDTPVVGFSFPPRLRNASTLGAAGYLLKPLSRAALERSLALPGRDVRKILAVDDEPDALVFMARLLSVCNPDYEVITASSGAETLTKMRQEQPDIVLLDIIMPDLSGWEVLSRIHNDPELAAIPVVIVSAQDPHDEPLSSPYIMGTIERGLSVSKLLRCSDRIRHLLLEPD